jgi:hypothetical protein
MRKCVFGRFALTALAVAAGLLGAGYFLGFGSHMSCAVSSAKRALLRQVPPDFEIVRIRGELNNIDKDIASNFDALAHETVVVKHLQQDLADARVRLEKQKKVVLALRQEVDTSNKTVSIHGTEYSTDELRAALTREFDAYKAAESAVKAKEEELKARTQARDAGRAKIEVMRSTKDQLTAELAKIEAEYKRVQVTEAQSPFQVDDSRLSGIKASMKNLKDRIDEMKLAHEYKAEFTHPSVVDQIQEKNRSEQVLKEIDQHFGNGEDRVANEKK